MWLYAHHVPLDLGLVLGLGPLGLMHRSRSCCCTPVGVRWPASWLRRRLPDVTRAVIPYALVYGVASAIVAGVGGSSEVRPHALARFRRRHAHCAAAAAGFGMLRASGLLDGGLRSVPFGYAQVLLRRRRLGLRPSLASRLLTARRPRHGLPRSSGDVPIPGPGCVGGVVLVLLDDGLRSQPGTLDGLVHHGRGLLRSAPRVTVSPQGVDYGPLPVFPPLAAMPPEGQPGSWRCVALLAPLLAGVVTGLLVHRRLRDRPGRAGRRDARRRLALWLASGLAVLCWLSAGSVADGN